MTVKWFFEASFFFAWSSASVLSTNKTSLIHIFFKFVIAWFFIDSLFLTDFSSEIRDLFFCCPSSCLCNASIFFSKDFWIAFCSSNIFFSLKWNITFKRKQGNLVGDWKMQTYIHKVLGELWFCFPTYTSLYHQQPPLFALSQYSRHFGVEKHFALSLNKQTEHLQNVL